MNNVILSINIPSILMSEINKNYIILIVSDKISGLIKRKLKAKQKEMIWKLSLSTYHEF